MPIVSGNPAPDFELSDDTSRVLRKLSDYRGRNIVLYFYPKDDTPYVRKKHVISAMIIPLMRKPVSSF